MKIRNSHGFATLLLVLVVSISIMLVITSLSKTIKTQNDVSIVSHAQTNSQILAWTGVDVFSQYLISLGKKNIENINELNGKDIKIREKPYQISVEDIKVEGSCYKIGDECEIRGYVKSKNFNSKSSSIIFAIYKVKVTNDNVQVISDQSIYFGGDTVFTGDTNISTEKSSTSLNLNVKGNLSLNLGFKTSNISNLIINATGDVYIDCGVKNCGDSNISINARGNVTVVNGSNFGDINSIGSTTLRIGASVKNITSNGSVYFESGSKAEKVLTNGNVTMTGFSRANQIIALGNISLYQATIDGNLESRKYVILSNSNVGLDVKAYEYVELNTGANVTGSVYAKGLKKFSGDIGVSHSLSNIYGNVYVNKDIYLWGLGAIYGKVFATGGVKGISNYVLKNGIQENKNVPELDFIISTFDSTIFAEKIENLTNFQNKVDVRLYKEDANYIFNKFNKFNKVFLNNLQNKNKGVFYKYENNSQYLIDSSNLKKFINNSGFFIGDYILNGKTYTGALCLEIENQFCKSEIVGYLPRLSVEKSLGSSNDYSYGEILNVWRIRSLSNQSSLENSVLAPGIMYFEGNLEFAGNANIKADSSTNTFVNTFIAEGDIWAIAFSPKIYSPYNIIKDNYNNVKYFCDRDILSVNGEYLLNNYNTKPPTESKKYLFPSNLCADINSFSYNMNLDDLKNIVKLSIDGSYVNKIDLGYVALMANGTINIGACSKIFGDILSRKKIVTSSACGITNDTNSIFGNIITQGESPDNRNDILSGTKIIVPSEVEKKSVEKEKISVFLKWTKLL